jgi:predicted RNA-binding Zn-ribbon protein involved in translation (DUF1610 family)
MRWAEKSVSRCVNCGAPLTQRNIWPIVPFPCPACGAQLQTADWYRTVAILAGLLCPMAIGLAVGVRTLQGLLVVELVGFLPSLYVFVNFLKFLIVPTVVAGLPKDATLNLRDESNSANTDSFRRH